VLASRRQVGLIADAEIRHCDKYAAVNCLPDIPVPTVWRYAASAKDRGAIFCSATIRIKNVACPMNVAMIDPISALMRQIA